MYVQSNISGCDLTEGKIYTVLIEHFTVYELKCDTGTYYRNKTFFGPKMTAKALISNLKQAGVEMCDICKHDSICSKSVTNYGSGPDYPPCADSDELSLYDIESYLDNQEVDE